MRQLTVVVGLVAVLAGCSSASSGVASTPLPSTAVSSAASSAAAAASSAAASASSEVSAGASAASSGPDAFLAYLRDTFPGVAWVQAVQGVRVVGGQAQVETTLTNDSTAAATAQQVCTAIKAYLPTSGAAATGAVILDRDGQTIVTC